MTNQSLTAVKNSAARLVENGNFQKMYQVAEMATPLHLQMCFQELASTEEHLQRQVSETMFYYRDLLFRFKKYCQEPGNRYFGKAQILDLADTLADLTMYIPDEKTKTEVQWLITNLHKMSKELYHEPMEAEEYSFKAFLAFCETIKPKALKITTAKKNKEVRIQVYFKTRAIFGRGLSFQEAFKNLILDQHRTP